MKRYTREHEWCELNDNILTVGITAHAAELLGDLVYIELPEIGSEYEENEDCAVVESVKAASDVYCPMAGTVTEVNEELLDAPESINDDPNTWMFRLEVSDTNTFNSFLTEEEYAEFCE